MHNILHHWKTKWQCNSGSNFGMNLKAFFRFFIIILFFSLFVLSQNVLQKLKFFFKKMFFQYFM